jgi:hypothetical protein
MEPRTLPRIGIERRDAQADAGLRRTLSQYVGAANPAEAAEFSWLWPEFFKLRMARYDCEMRPVNTSRRCIGTRMRLAAGHAMTVADWHVASVYFVTVLAAQTTARKRRGVMSPIWRCINAL